MNHAFTNDDDGIIVVVGRGASGVVEWNEVLWAQGNTRVLVGLKWKFHIGRKSIDVEDVGGRCSVDAASTTSSRSDGRRDVWSDVWGGDC